MTEEQGEFWIDAILSSIHPHVGISRQPRLTSSGAPPLCTAARVGESYTKSAACCEARGRRTLEMEKMGMQAAEPARNDAGPYEGLAADGDEPLIVVQHDGTRRYFSPQCKEQWSPDIMQLCLGLGADEELLGIRQGARAWVISEGKFIPPVEEHLLSGTFVALVRAIPTPPSPAAATPSQTNSSKGKSAALQLRDFVPPRVGNSENGIGESIMRPNGAAADGQTPLSPGIKEPAKATSSPNKAIKSAYASPKNHPPKLGARGRNAPGKAAAATFRIPPAACRKAANSAQARTRSVVARSSRPSSPYSPAPKACVVKNKAASKAPSPTRLKAPAARAEIEAVDSDAHQNNDFASSSAGKAPISNSTWEMQMATNPHLSSSAVKAPSNTTWEMLMATNPDLSSPEEQFSQVEGGFLLPDNELPELVAEATRKLEEAAETRRRLHARCQATGKLSLALEEVKRDLQPPGLTQGAIQALSHATEALCWSLNACKKTSRLLEDENSAIRCGLLRVQPSSPTTDVKKGAQEVPDADNDAEAEGSCIGVMADDEGTMQCGAENRNELRGRLVAHLRDALKMAQEPSAMLISLPMMIDEETASLSHWVIEGITSEEDATDADIKDNNSSRCSVDEAEDDAEDFYSAHSSDVEDDTQNSSVLPPEGRSPLVASSADHVDDLEGALHRLAEWYKEASERCGRAMELCCAPQPDDLGKNRVVDEGREDDAGPSAPIEFALEPHQDDPSGDNWFKDPFSDHERRLEDLVRRCSSARDAVERQLEGERECVDGLATQTDEAQRELLSVLDAVTASELRKQQNPPKAFVLSDTTQAFSAAVAFEEEFAEAACRQSAAQFKLELLRWACEARHGYLCGMAAGLEALIEGLAWAGGILCVQSAALDSEYPPSLVELQGWERRLCENQEDMEQTELDLKFARRRGRDTAVLEAKAEELHAVMRADRLDVKIMRERARLYAVAWEHFPELLAPGQPWARLVGLDAASDALAGLKRRGLLAEGRCFADFVTSECRADDGGKGADEVLMGTRRCVYDATDAEGRRWALKEYSLLGERSRRALWRHLCVLEDLRHPKLACVCAVFEDPSRGSAFVQMPWYGGGDLGQWLEATPPGARSVDQCRRLLSDAAEAVEHLHRHGFVHCDIKPSNMLLTKSRRLVLGDFDAVTTAGATLTRSLAGGTLGFIAPELTSGQQHYFTPATDIYALGIVAQKLLRDVEGAGDQGLEHMQDLINMMSSDDPAMRPSAVDVCLHAALRDADDGGTEAEDPRSCVVCWEIRQAGAGEQCRSSRSRAADAALSSSSSHFTCSDCLLRYVGSVSRSSPARKVELAEEHGRLGCPAEGCQGHLEPAAVLRHLDSQTADQYHAALHDGLEGRVRTLLQEDFDAQLQRLQDRLQEAQGGAMEERALQAEQTAIENILTIKCPRCKAAILDFDGCFALKCTQCGAGLCGWCMQDCGNDSHPHVAICRHKPSHGKYRYFAPKQLFEDAANRRRAKAVADYVNKRLPEDVRELVKERLRPHLRRLGIERKVKW